MKKGGLVLNQVDTSNVNFSIKKRGKIVSSSFLSRTRLAFILSVVLLI